MGELTYTCPYCGEEREIICNDRNERVEAISLEEWKKRKDDSWSMTYYQNGALSSPPGAWEASLHHCKDREAAPDGFDQDWNERKNTALLIFWKD